MHNGTTLVHRLQLEPLQIVCNNGACMKLKPMYITATSLISSFFGQETAKMYEEFYRDKDDRVIKASVKALLSELVGEVEADQVIKRKMQLE